MQTKTSGPDSDVGGSFVTRDDERYYAIHNVDRLPTFFTSLVSDADHWLFIASNGGLTAGRVSPDTALFPYVTVDKIYDSPLHTGSKTILRLRVEDEMRVWEPFNQEQDGRYRVTRNLYKNTLGNKLLFEEVNEDLQLTFRCEWATSEEYGFVRRCELENLGGAACHVDLVDGVQNILPAGTPRLTQTNSSYLVDAYKWNELDEATGLAVFTLYSAITDRAEPCESLRATSVFCLDLDAPRLLLSSGQLGGFRQGAAIVGETGRRGLRGAYLVNTSLDIPPGANTGWRLVADVEQTQSDVVGLKHQLRDPAALGRSVDLSVARGSDTLARLLSRADSLQMTAEENVSTHHHANVLFNVLRGGIFDDQYRIAAEHFVGHVKLFNRPLYARHRSFLTSLPTHLDRANLRDAVKTQDDPQLERLCYEYLPITFGRRHGDPSRPWNQFAIRLTDDHGKPLLAYQGNWRDIFQNWEALLLSYPDFVEHVIAKFVNASTADGYNPYRITQEGIDWEVEDPEDPWSYIGYWGDHQIIYLLKLLELSEQFHPARLGELLEAPLFSYANVPYKIKPFDALLEDAKSTVVYDHEQAARIEERVAELGADGKLLTDADGAICQVNLLEKLLVPLLCKLGNLVIDGGIWLNTQRPEWNDANNALVGQGLSMVTLYYMRRYVTFLQRILAGRDGAVTLSAEVARWASETTDALKTVSSAGGGNETAPGDRFKLLMALGQAADHYRSTLYEQERLSPPVSMDVRAVLDLLALSLEAIDRSITSNQRDDGLYEAYNLLEVKRGEVHVDHLYPMLEGQVAALSSGAIAPERAVKLLESLFDSAIFRADQNTFMLYPDRQPVTFLEKNRVPAEAVAQLPLLEEMLKQGDRRLIVQDADGVFRFNADLRNAGDLDARLDSLAEEYGDALSSSRESLGALYEQVFNHKAFTGRSGGMFGFEGLGCVYWHMVAKLLLAVQENFFAARLGDAADRNCVELGRYYYRVREGIGFNKTPAEFGAFPMDPYSHTPGHAGAQQPGMTGQVKEEIVARFGELGIRVRDGAVRFDTSLLSAREFADAQRDFRYLHVDDTWRDVPVPASGLAFTWCQVPFIYHLDDAAQPSVSVVLDNDEQQLLPDLVLPGEIAEEIFRRSGRIDRVQVTLNTGLLFPE